MNRVRQAEVETMKGGNRTQLRSFGMQRGATDDADRPLLCVHPIPADPDEILSITVHLLGHFAVVQGKAAPALSEDAARFLTRQRWALSDLASRLSRAVACNRGSLITAADLA